MAIKKTLRILIDTGSSSSIILKKCINKSVLVKNSRTTTEWTTLGEKLYTKKQGTVKFKLPEFFLNKPI
jgi:predicted aspartyl protease